jgi:hypothetical protein
MYTGIPSTDGKTDKRDSSGYAYASGKNRGKGSE